MWFLFRPLQTLEKKKTAGFPRPVCESKQLMIKSWTVLLSATPLHLHPFIICLGEVGTAC